jgi:small ubiquitin-related modifier
MAEKIQNKEILTLRVKSQDQDEIHFKIKKNTPLKKLMQKYCDRINVALNSASFVYEGEKIFNYNTPLQLNMRNDDEIQVVVEQTGGFFK